MFAYVVTVVKIESTAKIQQFRIDRFHSRDRWPQWCGETIRNI